MTTRRISRKQFLGMTALAGAGMMMAGGAPSALAAPMSLRPCAVPLPIPPKAVEGADRVIQISAKQFTQALHPQLPAVTVWGYSDGAFTHYPRPTIEVHKNSSTTVKFTNELPGPHPNIPIDTTLPGIDTRGTGPRILTHLHGGFVTGTSDGNPYATQNVYGKGQTQTVTYPAHPRATTLWYHDHALGMTRPNVYAGLGLRPDARRLRHRHRA